MRRAILALCAAVWAFGFDGNIERKMILQGYKHPNVLVFRANEAFFECEILGARLPFASDSCANESNAQKFVQMGFLAILYMKNALNVGQIYGVRVKNGYCAAYFRNESLSEKIVRDGYGVADLANVSDAFAREVLAIRVNHAREYGRGLWRDFEAEMACMSAK